MLRRTGMVSEELLGYSIPAMVECHLEGDTHISSVKTASLLAMELAPVLARVSPDVVVTIADRFETLGTAMAASYQNITLAHIQGGERSGNIDDKVRGAVTALADIHFPASGQAYLRIQDFGKENVHWVGCPSVDLALRCKDGRPLHYLHGGVGPGVDLSKPYVMFMLHPDTRQSYTDNYAMAEQTLAAIPEGVQVCGFWPGPDPHSEAIQKVLRQRPDVHLWRRLPPEVVYRLLLGAQFIIGNSSVGIRECESLGVWAINVGKRQMLRERGSNVIDVGWQDHINYGCGGNYAQAVSRVTPERPPIRGIYGQGDAGTQIAKILAKV